jgi:hypothetical protein
MSLNDAGFEVLTALTMKSMCMVFWVAAWCNSK